MNKLILACGFVSSIALVACGSNEEKKEPEQKVDSTTVDENVDTTTETLNEMAEFKFHVFLANVPSPLSTMILLPESGASVNKELLNSVTHADKYSTLSKKALNYGVYGVDLGYLTVYEQTQDVTDYFATLKTMAEGLGAAEQFNKVLSDRFQANANNKDSLLILMDKALGETEDYLKNNQKLETASLMLAGSWIENTHLLTNSIAAVSDAEKVKTLHEKLMEQKNSLASILDLLKEQNTADCKKVIADLGATQKAFEKIKTTADIQANSLKELGLATKALRDKTTAK